MTDERVGELDAMARLYRAGNIATKFRSCEQTVGKNAHHCKLCGIGSPGKTSRYPRCKAQNYVYHNYGFALIRALLATCLVGLLGSVFGFIGFKRTESICLECNQGWFPYMPEEQVGRFNTFIGEEGRMSRSYSMIPANCYD